MSSVNSFDPRIEEALGYDAGFRALDGGVLLPCPLQRQPHAQFLRGSVVRIRTGQALRAETAEAIGRTAPPNRLLDQLRDRQARRRMLLRRAPTNVAPFSSDFSPDCGRWRVRMASSEPGTGRRHSGSEAATQNSRARYLRPLKANRSSARRSDRSHPYECGMPRGHLIRSLSSDSTACCLSSLCLELPEDPGKDTA